MSAGRNDPCPCGSGKKYKKCCWSRDQQQREELALPSGQAFPSREPPEAAAAEDRSMWGPVEEDYDEDERAGEDDLDDDLDEEPDEEEDSEDAGDRAIRIAQDALWDDFEQRDYEGQLALFLESLDRPRVLGADLAFDMLESLRGEAQTRNDMERFEKLVDLLKERLPEVYAENAVYLLSWRVARWAALRRFDEIREPALEYARVGPKDCDLFERVLDLLAYHGRLDLLVEMFHAAWPALRDSDDVFEWAVDAFRLRGVRWRILHYCENTPSPQPDDPEVLGPLRAIVAELDLDYVRDFVARVLGRVQETVDPRFPVPGSRRAESKRQRHEADARWSRWRQRLGMEFLGHWHRENDVPYAKAELAVAALDEYLWQRMHGELSEHVVVIYPGAPAESAGRATNRRRVPFLCPDRKTLDRFLGGQLRLMEWRIHRVAAFVEAIPAWLRFLESRGAIDAGQRAATIDDLRSLHAEVLNAWKKLEDDPSLYQAAVEAWTQE